MGKKFALARARTSAAGAVVGMLIVAGMVALGGGPAAADVPTSQPPLLQRDENVVTSDPIPTVQIDNGYVWAQTTIGSTVYAVGKFDNAREPGAKPGTALTARSNVLAYDIDTGQLLPFAPKVNGVIKAVAASPDGSRIYIGGSFNSVNGKDRWNIAAIDAKTGELVPGFIPSIGGTGVYALATSGSSVYAGGLFTQANGTARKNLTAFNASDGKLLPWAPTTDLQVDAMVMDPAGKNTIVGGRFSQISGDTNLRGIGAVDKTTGTVDTAWQVPMTIKNGMGSGQTKGNAGIFSLTADATGVYGTGWAYASADTGNLEGTFAAEAGTGKIRWIADCLGDHYGVYSTGKVVYTTSHTHACGTMGLHPEQNPRVQRYSEAYTADARGTLGTQPNVPQYKDWAGMPAPSPYAWTPDWAVGVTTGMGQAGLSITGAGNMISIGGEFRSVNNGQFEGLVRFSTTPPGGAKDNPRLSGTAWKGTVARMPDGSGDVSVSIPANWDRDDLTLTYELYRAGTTAPVATTKANATWWNRPQVSLVDTSAPADTLPQYTVVAKDSAGNTATSAATTPLPTGSVQIVARNSGKAVAVSGTAEPTVQQTITSAPAQRWTAIPQANGTFTLKNSATGDCLAIKGGATNMTEGAPVIQYDCLSTTNFQWSLRDTGDGYSQLVSASSGQCLNLPSGSTAEGIGFVQYPCSGTPVTNSHFTLRPTNEPATPVMIVSRTSGMTAAVVGVTEPIVQQPAISAASRQWTPIPLPNGTFNLKNSATGACLAIKGGASNVADGASVIQYDCLKTTNFQWILKDVGNGYSQLIALSSGKCLTLPGGSMTEGTNFVQSSCTGTPSTNAQFTLRPAP